MLCNGQKKGDIEKIDFSYCNKYKIPKCPMYFFMYNVTRQTYQITPIKKKKIRS